MTDGPDSIWAGTYSRHPHGYWLDHRVMLAGERAGTLLLQMSDFCDVNRTDGVVADAQLALFGPARGRTKALEALADVGLVSKVEVPPGWQLAGWLDGHRSRDDWAAISAKRRRAGSKGGKSPRAPKPDPAPEDGDQDQPDPDNVQALLEQVASVLLDPAAAQPSPDQRSEKAAATAAGGGRSSGGSAVVVGAVAAALDRLSIDPATAGEAGLVQTIERAMLNGWTVEGIATKAAQARTKQHPLSWLVVALDAGADPAAQVQF